MTEKTAEPESLLFETSPFGNVDAIVEHDGRAVYFYLASPSDPSIFPTRACWVRNLIEGPVFLNKKEMEQGIPPILPKMYCRSPQGLPLPGADEMQIVWFEEGNGAALLIERKIAAVIPPWSGRDGFHGYAAECANESPICWPLPDTPQLTRRIDAAIEFWNQCNDAQMHPFKMLQSQLLAKLESRFGTHAQYYSIDGNQFPPRALVQFKNETHLTLVTIGMSLCPQPNVELTSEHPSTFRRTELAIQVSAKTLAPLLDQIKSQMSALAAFPWRRVTWFGSNHTVPLLPDAQIDDHGADFALLINDAYAVDAQNSEGQRSYSEIALPNFRGDPINLNWLVPISTTEKEGLQSGGTFKDIVVGRLPIVV